MNYIINTVFAYANILDHILVKLVNTYKLKNINANDFYDSKYATSKEKSILNIRKIKIDSLDNFSNEKKYNNITDVLLNDIVDYESSIDLFEIFSNIRNIYFDYDVVIYSNNDNFTNDNNEIKRQKNIDCLEISNYNYFFDSYFIKHIKQIKNIKKFYIKDISGTHNSGYNIDEKCIFLDEIKNISIVNIHFNSYYIYKYLERNLGMLNKLYISYDAEDDNFNNTIKINLEYPLEELVINTEHTTELKILLVSQVKKNKLV